MTNKFSRIVIFFLLGLVFFSGSAFYFYSQNNNIGLYSKAVSYLETENKMNSNQIFTGLITDLNQNNNFSNLDSPDFNTIANFSSSKNSVNKPKITASSSTSSSSTNIITLAGKKCDGSYQNMLADDFCTVFDSGIEVGRFYIGDQASMTGLKTQINSPLSQPVKTQECACSRIVLGRKTSTKQYFLRLDDYEIYGHYGYVYSYTFQSKKIDFVTKIKYNLLNAPGDEDKVFLLTDKLGCDSLINKVGADYSCFYRLRPYDDIKTIMELTPENKLEIDSARLSFPALQKAIVDYGLPYKTSKYIY